jgi:hypothetical protein
MYNPCSCLVLVYNTKQLVIWIFMLSIFGTAILLYCTLMKFIFIAMGFKIRKIFNKVCDCSFTFSYDDILLWLAGR